MNTINLKQLPLVLENIVKDYYYQLEHSAKLKRVLTHLSVKYDYEITDNKLVSMRHDNDTGGYCMMEFIPPDDEPYENIYDSQNFFSSMFFTTTPDSLGETEICVEIIDERNKVDIEYD